MPFFGLIFNRSGTAIAFPFKPKLALPGGGADNGLQISLEHLTRSCRTLLKLAGLTSFFTANKSPRSVRENT
jgi:hypothetical protein